MNGGTYWDPFHTHTYAVIHTHLHTHARTHARTLSSNGFNGGNDDGTYGIIQRDNQKLQGLQTRLQRAEPLLSKTGVNYQCAVFSHLQQTTG